MAHEGARAALIPHAQTLIVNAMRGATPDELTTAIIAALSAAGALRTAGTVEVCEKCGYDFEHGNPHPVCHDDTACPLQKDRAHG